MGEYDATSSLVILCQIGKITLPEVVSFEAVNRDIEIYEEVRVLLDNIRVQENKVSIRLDEINPNDQVGDI